ncbi:MAG: DUF4405 domain-containing protein [Treponema sp.]|nr:DUF4405 domain-containing protein [Treponema sp.]
MKLNLLRIPLDILMTLLSIILMGGTVLFPDDRVHQIMGMSLLALWAVHIALNRRWFGSLFRKNFAPFRIMQLVVNLGVLICALFLMISGLLMAWFIPSDWVGGALGFARITHLLASHWYYIFMAFHIGLHGAMIISKCFNRLKSGGVRIILRTVYIVISLYGVYAFIIRGVWKYMFGLQQFFFFDFERGYILFALDYISIIVLFGTVSYFLCKLLSKE